MSPCINSCQIKNPVNLSQIGYFSANSILLWVQLKNTMYMFSSELKDFCTDLKQKTKKKKYNFLQRFLLKIYCLDELIILWIVAYYYIKTDCNFKTLVVCLFHNENSRNIWFPNNFRFPFLINVHALA